MSLQYECKICGGVLIPDEGGLTGVCESCGSKSVIPKESTNSGKINRANYLRRASEFDKAQELFEQIVSENPDDSEAYWGLVLCKYGIEYVDDSDGTKKPTCHRTMFDSILNDPDYKAAVEHSVGAVRYIYEEEAEKINEIQKKIKAIAANEKPYDIFICYKESDDLGQRTRDSVDAQDIYNRLVKKGYKVFYARKTLRNLLGSEYEPIIFAALSSAKIMLVYGSKPEFFGSVWLRNEWSRFRRMMKDNPEKKIIPIYDGASMSAYDLPNELVDFQAFDKYRVGFMEELIEGLDKMLEKKDEPKAGEVKSSENLSSRAKGLLERGYLFLEDNKWDEADSYFEKVLDEEPKESEAYLGKLMAQLHLSRKSDFEKNTQKLDDFDNFKKALRFGSKNQKAKLEEYANLVIYNEFMRYYKKANDNSSLISAAEKFETLGNFRDSAEIAANCRETVNSSEYNRAVNKMNNVSTPSDALVAAAIFENLGDYRDSKELRERCLKLADKKDEEVKTRAVNTYKSKIAASDNIYDIIELKRNVHIIKKKSEINNLINMCNDKIYSLSLANMKEGIATNNKNEIIAARDNFRTLSDYGDSAAMAKECDDVLSGIYKNERKKENIRNIIILSSITAVVVFILVMVVTTPPRKYAKAIKYEEDGNHVEALNLFMELADKDYKEAKVYVPMCRYEIGVELYNAQNYETAMRYFREAGEYRDAPVYLQTCVNLLNEAKYQEGLKLLGEGQYYNAREVFNALGGYKDVAAQIQKCNDGLSEIDYQKAMSILNTGDYTGAREKFVALGDYKDSATRVRNIDLELKYRDAISAYNSGDYQTALTAFEGLDDYKDSSDYAYKCNAVFDKSKFKDAYINYLRNNGYTDGYKLTQYSLLDIDGNGIPEMLTHFIYPESDISMTIIVTYKDGEVRNVYVRELYTGGHTDIFLNRNDNNYYVCISEPAISRYYIVSYDGDSLSLSDYMVVTDDMFQPDFSPQYPDTYDISYTSPITNY